MHRFWLKKFRTENLTCIFSQERNLSFSDCLSLVSLARWLFYLFYKHMSADVFILCLSSLFSYSIKIPPSLQIFHCLSVPYFHPICIHISALGMKTKLYMVLRFPTVQPPLHTTLPLPPLSSPSLWSIFSAVSVCLPSVQAVKLFPLSLYVHVATDFISTSNHFTRISDAY